MTSISPVVWNTEAFESLVVDEDTKQMVKALVINHLAGGKTTDLMDGKGNGLVILLHGLVMVCVMRITYSYHLGVLEREKHLQQVSTVSMYLPI